MNLINFIAFLFLSCESDTCRFGLWYNYALALVEQNLSIRCLCLTKFQLLVPRNFFNILGCQLNLEIFSYSNNFELLILFFIFYCRLLQGYSGKDWWYMAAFRAFWNSPVGPKTTHFWGPVANWGFVAAVCSAFTILYCYLSLYVEFCFRVRHILVNKLISLLWSGGLVFTLLWVI